jgi:hypothetical protein
MVAGLMALLIGLAIIYRRRIQAQESDPAW